MIKCHTVQRIYSSGIRLFTKKQNVQEQLLIVCAKGKASMFLQELSPNLSALYPQAAHPPSRYTLFHLYLVCLRALYQREGSGN